MNRFKLFLASVLLISGLHTAFAQVKIQNTGKLSGVIVNRLTQKNAVGVLVALSPGSDKMITDSNGAFRFTSLLPGAYAIKVTGTVRDKAKLLMLEEEFAVRGYKKIKTPQGTIYRIPKQ